MQISTESNISFDGIEYISHDGICDVPDTFPLDLLVSHGLSINTEPVKAKPGRPSKSKGDAQ